jgi:hypothetical protein
LIASTTGNMARTAFKYFEIVPGLSKVQGRVCVASSGAGIGNDGLHSVIVDPAGVSKRFYGVIRLGNIVSTQINIVMRVDIPFGRCRCSRQTNLPHH